MGKTIKTIMIVPGSAGSGWSYRDIDSNTPLPERPPEKINVVRSASLQARMDREVQRPIEQQQPQPVVKKQKTTKRKPAARAVVPPPPPPPPPRLRRRKRGRTAYECWDDLFTYLASEVAARGKKYSSYIEAAAYGHIWLTNRKRLRKTKEAIPEVSTVADKISKLHPELVD